MLIDDLLYKKIVSVDGDLSEILETSCGTWIFAVGSTIYELSDIGDLESRGIDVLEMFSDTCVTADTPSTADCYTYVWVVHGAQYTAVHSSSRSAVFVSLSLVADVTTHCGSPVDRDCFFLTSLVSS